jgi:RNA-binding protein YhbY
VPQIKIGRRGCTESLITSIHNHWRNFECVKLRIHDDKVCWGGGGLQDTKRLRVASFMG